MRLTKVLRGFILAVAALALAAPSAPSLGQVNRIIRAQGVQLPYAGAKWRTFAERAGDRTVTVKDFGAKCDGTTDDTTAFASAIASGKAVFVPAGTCLTNITVTTSGVRIFGEGPRVSILRPYADAPVITIDSTAASRQRFALENVGLENDTSGSFTHRPTAKGVLITGANINDWNSFEHVYVDSFVNGFDIEGRTIWSRWKDVEITNSSQIGFRCVTAEPVNGLRFDNVRIASSQWEGAWIEDTGASLVFQDWVFHIFNPESNGLDIARATVSGVYLANVENFQFDGLYAEGNGASSTDGLSAAVRMGGTYAANVNINNGYLVSSNFGVVANTTWLSGSIHNTRITYKGASGYGISLHSGGGNAAFGFIVGSNVRLGDAGGGAGAFDLPYDVNGKYAFGGGLVWEPADYLSAASTSLDLTRVASFTSFVASDYTISALVNPRPGLHIFFRNAHASNTVTFDSSLMVSGTSVSIPPGGMVEFTMLGYPNAGKLRVLWRNNVGSGVNVPGVSPDRGDADVGLTPGVDYETQLFDTPLTTGRGVTLGTPLKGAKFRIVRTTNATGASGLNLSLGLASLAVGQWCEVEANGTTWVLTAKGSL